MKKCSFKPKTNVRSFSKKKSIKKIDNGKSCQQNNDDKLNTTDSLKVEEKT